MLAPHHREDAELGEVGRAAEDRHRARIFLGAEAVFGGKRGADRSLGQVSASTRPAKNGTPSIEPCSGCVASSGCGIRPSTVLVSLKMPAMLRAEPLGLCCLVERAVRPAIAEGDAAFAFEPVQRLVIGEVIAVVMRDRHRDHLARLIARGEDGLAVLDAQIHVLAVEFERLVAQQRARQQPRLGQDLEAVADAEHGVPRAAAAFTSRMTGECAAIAPQRR